MNIKQRAELLKNLIEICDTEIFPTNPIDVHIINKSLRDNPDTASYNTTLYFKMMVFVPLIIIIFVIVKMMFFLKRNSLHRQYVVMAFDNLRLIRIGMKSESYFVTKQKHLLKMDALKLASIACHEVRHRVQYHYIEGMLTKICKPHVDLGLLERYRLGRLKAQTAIASSLKVNKNDLETECDARFIQHIIEKRLSEKFPDGKFSDADFRNFIQENKELLIWENPYLK